MSSILPSPNFCSSYKFYQNDQRLFNSPQNITQFNDGNNINMHCGLTMLLDDHEDCFLPFSNNNNLYDVNNFLLSENNANNVADCYSSNSNTMMEFPGFENSSLEYYNRQIKGQSPNSSGNTTTYDEFESNMYSTLQNYVPSPNNYATTPQCWGFQGHTTQVCGSENSCGNNNNTKVGKYSVEEKKDRILRYLKKRNQRNFRKTIKYACRKTLADRRVRIRGRFAKNQEEEESTNYNYTITQHKTGALPFHNGDYKKEQCSEMDEEWLQETMASLLYVPCISGWHPELHRS